MNESAWEAEKAVLGAALEDSKKLVEAAEVLSPRDFGDDANRAIFAAMLDLHRRGEPVDLTTVGAELGPRLIRVADRLGALPDAAPLGSLPPYCRIVKDAAQRRRLEALAQKIPVMFEGGASPDEVAASARQALEDARAAGPARHRLTFSPASDLTGFQEPTRWIVKPFLEAGTLSCLFAPPESLKTFVVVDLGLSIATGRSWYGQRVTQGNVFYLCGEGWRGIGRRISAWEKFHGVKADGFFVSNCAAQLLDHSGPEEVEAASTALTADQGPPALVIIDTLNRNFGPGDENNTADMTRFIAALDHLRDRLQCAVLVVHHSGLVDTGRVRGNSALRGALDFEYCITPRRSGPHVESFELSCSKCKDHDRPPTMSFKPVVVDLGLVDEDMRPITSLVLERTEYVPPQPREKRLPPQQLIAIKALEESGSGGPVGLDEWREAAYRLGIADTPEAKRKAFNRSRTALLADGLIVVENDLYRTAGQGGTLAGHVPECHGDLAGQPGHTLIKGVPCPGPGPTLKKNEMSRSAREKEVRL